MPAGKCIVLLLDGTWNDSEIGDTDTNIVRLRELIISGLETSASSSGSEKPFVSRRSFAGRPIVVYYDRGVGTSGFFDRILGGALGAGLEDGIRRAYRFLSDTFESGDEVFVFGFSRGAYTARSLAGFIGSVGLLRSEENTSVNESRAWAYYRTSPKDRLATVMDGVRKLGHQGTAPLITCLGVFDTVGARGIPIRWFWRENRDLFEFHDVELSSTCRTNLHALAIDEHREAFQASIWRRPKFVDINSTTEQVWFAGAHADVGGGYVNYYDRIVRKPDKPDEPRRSLDDISLDWMIKRLKKHHPSFPLSDERLCLLKDKRHVDSSWAGESAQHEARKGFFYRPFPFAWRSIGNCSKSFSRWSRQRFVCQDRHATPIGEMVHISALERWGKPVKTGWRTKPYAPPNLRLAIDRITETYSEDHISPEGNHQSNPLYVVDWSGHPLDPIDAQNRKTVGKLIGPVLK